VSVAAAIRITSPDEGRVIEHAAEFARQQGETCYVISVIRGHGVDDEENEIVRRNFQLISDARAVPVMQEGDDIAPALIAAARWFGVRTLFLQSGTSRLLGRSIAEQLLYLDPPCDVIVVSSE